MSEYLDTSVIVKWFRVSEDHHHTKDKTKGYLKKFEMDVKTLKDL